MARTTTRAYLDDFRGGSLAIDWQIVLGGLWYSLTILAILGAHEFGHYFACVRYRVNATLPYFIPMPPPVLTGTLGAFIRIRQPIRTKRVLFDIGIAGPLAGFVVAVPALFIGVWLSHVVGAARRISRDSRSASRCCSRPPRGSSGDRCPTATR